MLESSPSEMLAAGGWLCLELGDSLSALLKGARLYSAWYERPSTGSFSCRSSWAVDPLQQCGSALPTMCTTSLEPSWWTVFPPVLEPSFACRIREESALGLFSSLSGVPGSAAPGWLSRSPGWAPGSAAASWDSDLNWAVCAAALRVRGWGARSRAKGILVKGAGSSASASG